MTAQGVSTLVHRSRLLPTAALRLDERRPAPRGGRRLGCELVRHRRSHPVRPLGAHRGLAVALYHQQPRPARAADRPGPAPRLKRDAFTHDTTLQIDGTWREVVRGSVPPAGCRPTLQGLLVLLAGAIVSLLLFALVLVLTRSRERALGMVQEKTGELRHQALHDALTGPAQPRARARPRRADARPRAPPAASPVRGAVHRHRRLQARQRHLRARRRRRAAAGRRRAARRRRARGRHRRPPRRRRVRRAASRAPRSTPAPSSSPSACSRCCASRSSSSDEAGRPLSITASIGIAVGAARQRRRAAARRRPRPVRGEGGRQEPLRAVRAEHADRRRRTG